MPCLAPVLCEYLCEYNRWCAQKLEQDEETAFMWRKLLSRKLVIVSGLGLASLFLAVPRHAWAQG